MNTLVILCLLGDPGLPAVSVQHTGGFQVDVQELLSNLEGRPWNVHIITNTSPYCVKTYERHDTYQIHRVSFHQGWAEYQNIMMGHFEDIYQQVLHIFQELDEKPVLVHSFYWLSGMLAKRINQELEVPYVHTVVSLAAEKICNNVAPRFEGQFEAEQGIFSHAFGLFAISQTEKNQLQQVYKVNPEKIRLVGRGVHPVFLEPCRQSNGLPRGLELQPDDVQPVSLIGYPWWTQGAFLFLGRLDTIKGLDYIILAWINLYSKYQDKMPPLWICGGSPAQIAKFRNNIKSQLNMKRLEALEASQKIVWWGYLDAAGISTLFLKTLALVTFSKAEAGGRVLLEALAASVPAIATKTGFGKDLIVHGENGMLISYGDRVALEGAMECFIRFPEKQPYWKENARKTYLTERNKWKCYEQQFAMYHTLGLRD